MSSLGGYKTYTGIFLTMDSKCQFLLLPQDAGGSGVCTGAEAGHTGVNIRMKEIELPLSVDFRKG